MASIRVRSRADGGITHVVLWREDGRQPTESFDSPTQAEAFKLLIEANGGRKPEGWIRGHGFVDPSAAALVADAPILFREWAPRVINSRTGVESRTRADYMRDVAAWMYPTFGDANVRVNDEIDSEAVRLWVNNLERSTYPKGKDAEGNTKYRRLSPKTVRNLHGLLSSILQAAVDHDPQIRTRNPCVGINLPRVDDEIEDEQCFLTPDEVALLISCFSRRTDQLAATIAYGTAVRYGELTALQPQDLVRLGTRPAVRVQRAWKRRDDGTYYMGAPKSKKSRRTLTITPTVVDALDELGQGKGKKALLLVDDAGNRLHYSSFGDRWERAVKKATALGLDKDPTPHDLRHSAVAALIAAGTPLPAIQRRLGHESIQTTVDTYGHLLPDIDDAMLAAVEATLSGIGTPQLRLLIS
ncbi:site-specific integrase [Streptomyces sp. SID3343]|uniref:tyrosine-type recombinase/integrase n=1 Tax=Streptomyces sp. SID3343 TaxID=2690260 RepID=UPI00136DC8EE|nr:site-specific integrase [Streptomyces sp. SID3343]MYW03498.1 tyrosine-type recombinase/integrase [Streptomyces sp. SID3343]